MKYDITTEQLTAYMLDELGEDERAGLEQALEQDAEARATLSELRAAAAVAREAFRSQPAHALTDAQREAIRNERANVTKLTPRRRLRRRLTSVLAAMVAVALGATYLWPGLLAPSQEARETMQLARQLEVIEGRLRAPGDTSPTFLERLGDDIDYEDLLVQKAIRQRARQMGMEVSPGALDVIESYWAESAYRSPERITRSLTDVDGDLDGQPGNELQDKRVKDLMAEGQFLLEHKKGTRALEKFNEALTVDPDNRTAQRLQAEATVAAYDEDQTKIWEQVRIDRREVRKSIEDTGKLPAGYDAKGFAQPRVNGIDMMEANVATSISGLKDVNVIITDTGADPYGPPGNGGMDPQAVASKKPVRVDGEVHDLAQAYPYQTAPFYGNDDFDAFDYSQGGGSRSGQAAAAIRARQSLKRKVAQAGVDDDGDGFVAEPRALPPGETRRSLESLGYLGGGGSRSGQAGQEWRAHFNGAYVDGRTLAELVQERVHDTGQHPDFNNDPSKVYWPGHNTEAYDQIVENPFKDVVGNPLSTFSIDVDTASYSNMRRFLNQNALPPRGAVRIEELVNYFSYDYSPPDGEDPFSAHVEVAACPWNNKHRLARIGLKGWEMKKDERPASNLVFLIDVSGSMGPENKLPLLQRAMKLLVKQLGENDQIAMVVYAGSSGLVLPSTNGDNQEAILDALRRLKSGGSTNGGQGIRLAYDTAVANFIDGGINRVILATDGDFNVGVTDESQLTSLIEEKAKTGVFLTVLGFGMGNLKDGNLEKLADKGNGNYAYIDTINEARKVLVEEMSGTLVTIAKDVKIQVEFNPAQVNAYRLIGYENRVLAAEDFNDDTKDAGEIGAGHTVTALYELVPAGVAIDLPNVDPLKYQQPTMSSDADASDELLTLKLRYKQPDGDTSKLLVFPAVDKGKGFGKASPDFKFASSVAGFGMLLRDSEYKGKASFDRVMKWAEAGKGEDLHGHRAEFIGLVKKAMALSE